MSSRQDLNGVRTAQDLERKYDFASLLGLKKNIETQAKSLIKLDNELNSILKSLIINLKNVLDSQSEVSLWFYSGVPTSSNKPYILWNNPAEHYGDIYYDKNSGYVYQFNENSWERNEDYNLVQAMALTNTELDTSTDFERKVFFSQPIPPYDSGDWWIKEDGTLYICQLGKAANLQYEENDFIISSKYTTTVAIKQNDEITVLKGTVTQITEDYVKFTDLSTGGSTTIAGENITTGTIKSQNYVSGKTGMKIDLSNGTIDTKNTKWDEYGNILMNNGAEVIGDKGLLTNLQFLGKGTSLGSYEFANLGLELDLQNNEFIKIGIELLADIPSNLTIQEAYITLIHQPIYWQYETETATNKLMGWSRSIGLFKSDLQSYHMAEYGSEYYNTGENKTEISNAFGSSGWTPSTPTTSSSKVETKKSIDIKSQLIVGKLNKFIIESKKSLPSWNTDYFQNVRKLCENTGRVMAILNVIGYIK